MQLFTRLFHINKEEGKPFLILFVHFFCFSAMGITAGSTRDAFFLTLFEKTYLPLIYVAIAIVMAGVIPLYTKLSRNINITNVILVSSVIFGLSMFPLIHFLSGWFIPMFYIWIEVIIVLTITQFWILAGEIFNVRQAKRLFGLISGSGAIASMVIGFSIRPFVQTFGSEKLLYATAFFLGIISITSFLIKPYHITLESGSVKSISKNVKEEKKKKFDQYLIGIIVLISAMAIVSKYVDYQFKISASNAYPTQDELVNFFGLFYAVTGAAAFIVQFFLTGKILSKYGVLVGLLILPAAVFAGSVGFLMIPVLVAIFIPKFADQVFKFTINNATIQLLWLPIPSKVKKETKPVIDGTIKAFMEGIAGLTIFFAARWMSLHLLSIAVLVITATWIYYTFRIKNGYVKALQKAIEKRQLNFEELEIDVADNVMVETIDKALHADEEVKQLFALEMIEGIPLTPWAKSLNKLFHDSTIGVRNTVLNISAENSKIISDEELLDAMKNRNFAEIAMNVAGIRNLSSAIPILETYLSDSDPELQLNAAASLQRLQSDKIPEARKLIQEKMSSNNPKIQAMAIRLLVDQDNILTQNLLIQFLESPSGTTSNAALFVAGERKSAELIPAIISNLANPKTLPTARHTLQTFSDELVIPELLKTLSNNHIELDLLRGIVIVLKVYRSQETIDALIGLLDRKEQRVLGDTIDTLLNLARQARLSDEHIISLSGEIHKISRITYQFIDFLNDVQIIDDNHLLNEVLQHEISKQIPYLLKLGIIDQPSTPVESYLQTINKRDQTQMPFVLEVLDNIFEGNEKELITPVVEGLPLTELTELGKKHFDEIPMGLDNHLYHMIYGKKEWSSAVAMDFVLKHQFNNVLKNLDWSQITHSRILKEIVTSYDISDELGEYFKKNNVHKEESFMYSTLEKTILLKTVNLFQTIPTEDLSNVAQIAEEEHFPARSSLFKEGDYGDSLYIIMDGDINIHKGDRHIALLSKGACLGEMALLDQEPRSADATTKTEATLLKITQEDFYEIMSSNIEIMQGILKLLTGRLRDAIN